MTDEAPTGKKSAGGHLRAALRITIVTFGSRILGLVRDVMMYQMLGLGWAMGTFALAWMVPNLLRRLFGEGALSASFIPVYTRVLNKEPADGRRLLGSVTGVMLLFLGIVTALVVTAGLWVPGDWVGQASSKDGVLQASAGQQGELLLELTVILFPYAIPICLAAVFAGALNTHGVFALPAAAPIVLNLFWIGGLGLAMASGLRDPAAIVTLVATCLMVGGIAQMSLSLIPVWRRRLIGALSLPRAGDPSLQVIRNMGPTVIGMSLVQLNTLMDSGLAFCLFGATGPSFIYAANRLLLFPHALTSLALATAIFPRFSKLGAADDRDGLRQTTDLATHHTLLIAVPAAVGMMLVAQPLIELMVGGELTGAEDLATATLTTVLLLASLPWIGVAQLHARALYALGDYRTPAWMSFWLLILNLVLNVILVVGFGMGVPGLALATTIASMINAFALRRKVTTACPGKAHGFNIGRTLLATTAMAGAVYGMQEWVQATSRWEQALFDLALPIGVGMTVYGGLLYLLGQRNLRMH